MTRVGPEGTDRAGRWKGRWGLGRSSQAQPRLPEQPAGRWHEVPGQLLSTSRGTWRAKESRSDLGNLLPQETGPRGAVGQALEGSVFRALSRGRGRAPG